MGKEKAKAKSSENIRVVVRCRPLNSKETNDQCKEAVHLDLATHCITVHHAHSSDPDRFTFDAVYNNSFTQKDIYNQEVKGMVDSVLGGYNATVFAYGQSGSGKTHTMTGVPDNADLCGVMPNAIQHIFEAVSKKSSQGKQFKVKVSHLELYNGKARDLLSADGRNLNIKQNQAKNFYVQDLLEKEVHNPKETLRLFDESVERRRTGVTDLNEHSSRSHSIFAICVECIDFEADPTAPQIMHSKLNLVDLAGSERQGKTGASGDTLKEGCNINLSLTALGTVIDVIVKGGQHVPYRSSPLTMLLKDSLGGNSKTVMFANVGPADRNVHETVSTLRFADRAKQITNKPVKNLDPKDAKINQLMEKIAELQARLGGDQNFEDNDALREKMEQMEAQMDNLRQSGESEIAVLTEELKIKQQTIDELTNLVKERDAQIAQLAEEQKLAGETNSDADRQLGELRNVVSTFVKNSTMPDEWKKITAKRKVEEPGPDGSWIPSQLMILLEGVRELMAEMRKCKITDEDVKRHLFEQSNEFESKFNAYRRQQEQEKAVLQEAKRNLQEKQDTLDKELAAAKVALDQKTKEAEKLRAREEKSKKKMTEKFEKLVGDLTNVSAQFELEKTEWEEAKKTEARKEEQDKVNLERKFAEERKAFADSLEKAKAQAEEEKAVLRKQIDERSFEAQQLQGQVNDLETSVRKLSAQRGRSGRFGGETAGEEDGSTPAGEDLIPDGGDGTSPDGEAQHADPTKKNRPSERKSAKPGRSSSGDTAVPSAINEGMIADDENEVYRAIVDEVQHQLRLHAHLQAIRHQQQVHLETLLKSHRDLQAQQSTASQEKVKEVEAKYQALLHAKEDELSQLAGKHEKDTDKMLKKINKKMQEFQQIEAKWSEEKLQAEEEKKELLEINDELQQTNQALEKEVEEMRRNKERAVEEKKQNEVHFTMQLQAVRKDLEAANDQVLERDRRLADMDSIEREKNALLAEKESMERMLQDRMVQLENNRQMWKWSNTLLEKEKDKTRELLEEIERQKAKIVEVTEEWKHKLVDNGNKLVAINNKKIAEQEHRHQAMLEEEYEKQKAIQAKLRKSKRNLEKEKQRFDELVLSHEQLTKNLEETKITSMRMFMDKSQMDFHDGRNAVNDLIRAGKQQQMANRRI